MSEGLIDKIFFNNYLCVSEKNSMINFNCMKFKTFTEADTYCTQKVQGDRVVALIIPVMKILPSCVKKSILKHYLKVHFEQTEVTVKLTKKLK